MPYSIRKRGSKFVVVNTQTGKVKGTHSTKSKAASQMRLLYGVKRGWHPTGKPKPAKKPKRRR